jgi:phage terminase small subunit
LTDKQKKFCDEYLIDLNATQAAIRAGYSEKTAYSIGDENLRKPELQEYIQKRQKEGQERAEITRGDIIDQLKSIGFVDLDVDNIKATDKIKALELMARMLGLDKPETENDTGIIAELLKGLRES